MADNTTRLMLTGLMLLRDLAPKASGNMAFNSMIAFKTPKGVRYVQRGNTAPYGAIINVGRGDRKLSQKEQSNVGWWDVRAFGAMKELWLHSLNTQLPTKTIQRLAREGHDPRTDNKPTRREKVLERSLPKR